MEPNLLTHQIAVMLQELALPEFQGTAGLARIVSRLADGLARVGTTVEAAALTDFRKLYHVDWSELVAALCPATYRELATDRFKKLVF